ncbi:dienelactone hydrolase family protein [soil metagenome]
MHTELIEYADDKQICEAFVAYDDSKKEKRPAVLISHAWGGQGKFEQEKATKLAELGYVGFALDNYGKGRRGSSMEENGKLMQPFMDDRAMLRQRLLAGLAAARKHPMVGDKIAVIGFCFGGLCALDLARVSSKDAGAKGVNGAVAFHGLFHPPALGKQEEITAKVLMLHGYDDPMATPADVMAVAKELTEAKADWQLHAYGHTSHAFTNPEVNMPANGMQFNATADKRSWQSMQNFLSEVFA